MFIFFYFYRLNYSGQIQLPSFHLAASFGNFTIQTVNDLFIDFEQHC